MKFYFSPFTVASGGEMAGKRKCGPNKTFQLREHRAQDDGEDDDDVQENDLPLHQRPVL